MTIYQVYFDETGTHDISGHVRLVGLWGWHGFWPEFDKQWCNILNEPPATRFWHTVSAHKGELLAADGTPLPRDARERKELLLAELLNDCGVRGKIQSVELELRADDWLQHFAGKVNLAPKFAQKLSTQPNAVESKLFVLVGEALRLSVELAAPRNEQHFPGDPLHVWNVFEDNESASDFQYEAIVSYWALRKLTRQESRKVLGPVVFLPGKGPLAQTTLGAADFYAWHVNSVERGSMPPLWGRLSAIRRNRRQIDADRLQSIVSRLNKGEPFELC
jgi:hypothetical protein